MTDSKNSRIWVALVAGLMVFGAATWLSQSDSPVLSEGLPHESSGRTSPLESVARPNEPASSIRIAEHGRLSLAADALPTEGPLRLVLALPDEARGAGPRIARIISVDGRRIDTMATPLPGAGSGVQLDIDVDFLTPGLYMIEVQTVETTHLHLRRYVLELE